MSIKNSAALLLSLLTGVSLVACNGGGAAGPAATTQYGQILSESAQQLGAYSSMQVLYPVMLQAGYYGSIESGSFVTNQGYESANILNTGSEYNYQIKANLANGYFKTAGVSAYAVEYTTPGENADTDPSDITHNASGLIILPQGIKPRGVVVYFHPTTLGKNQVPSCIKTSGNIPAYCNITAIDNTGFGLLASLGATYAARGFAVIAPDYVGQGADYNSVHPYVAYPENNVQSAFYMLPALRDLLAKASPATAATEKLPLLITGYSEGGGYALKASQMAQNSYQQYLADNGVYLKMTSPQEGAYSLSDQMNFAFAENYDGLFNCPANVTNCGKVDMMKADQSGLVESIDAMNNWNVVSAPAAASYKPGLTSYVLTAVAYYQLHNLSGAYDSEMNHQFWADIHMLDGSGVIANLYQLFSGIYGTKFTGGVISNSITYNAFQINGYDTNESKSITVFSPLGDIPVDLPANHYGSNNSALNFIQPGVATNPVFEDVLVSGSTYNWKTASPINLIHMIYDSAVVVTNSDQAYSCMKNGFSYPGSPTTEASAGVCSSSSAAGNLVESTIITNFQMVNNAIQFIAMADPTSVNPLAKAKFWTYNSSLGAPVPFDHGDMFALGNIIALCTFENMLENGTNSGRCPSF